MSRVMDETKHRSVLLQEAVDGLQIESGDIIVDATLGGGGHAREILKRVLSARNATPASNASRSDAGWHNVAGRPKGQVIAIDADQSALDRFQETAQSDELFSKAFADKSFVLVHENYSSVGGVLEHEGVANADAILADLGFSSDQIEDGSRGLSFQKSGALDMRLNQETELTAEKIVNTFLTEEIEKILCEYGDESESWRIARAIVKARSERPLVTTDELSALIEDVYPKSKRYKMKIHPATRTFQALRIAVNKELEHLERFLEEAMKHLSVGGRLAIITFHSGEDRIVSKFFKSQAKGCICPPGFPVCRCGSHPKLKILTKKPIIPGEEEMKNNPRSRSAKLRIAEKLR